MKREVFFQRTYFTYSSTVDDVLKNDNHNGDANIKDIINSSSHSGSNIYTVANVRRKGFLILSEEGFLFGWTM